MHARTLAVCLAIFCIESTAAAGPYLACNELLKGDKAACSAAAAKKCAAIAAYWDRQKCAEQVAVGFDQCLIGSTYEKTCKERKAAYYDVCMKAGELDMNRPSSVDAFRRRALAYQQTLESAVAFDKEWSPCFTHSDIKTCQAGPGDLEQCKRAGPEFKKTFADAVDFYLGNVLQNNLNNAADALRRGDFGVAKSIADNAQRTLQVLADLNAAMPALRHRQDDLAAAITAFEQRKKDIDAAYEKALAKVRCPRAKLTSKKVLAQLRPAIDAFFLSTNDTKLKVRAFRLSGKKQTLREKAHRTTTESYPGHVCTEKTNASETFCQVFSVSVKRKKVDGEAWQEWVAYVGAAQRMLCKNLK